MKFHMAWAKIEAQNTILKLSLTGMSLAIIALSIATARVSLKDPLILERASKTCFTEKVEPVSIEHTQVEMEAFIRSALHQRFNTGAETTPTYLSAEELASQTKEQKELSQRNMTQTLIVRKVQIQGKEAEIEADRLISVGEIRSAFSFPLKVILNSQSRTEINPYGLLLYRVTQKKCDGDKCNEGSK